MQIRSLLFLCLVSWSLSAQDDIQQARLMNIGETVTIRGISLNGSELGIIRYFEDQTAGIAVYPGSGSAGNLGSEVKIGDEVEVTGVLTDFHGLLEINPVNSYTIISNGNLLPPAQEILPANLDESVEGRHVQVLGGMFPNGGDQFEGNKLYPFSLGGNSVQVYIRNDHPIIGTVIPIGSIDLTGIATQHDEYQLLIRGAQDLVRTGDFFISNDLYQDDIEATSFVLSWESSQPGKGGLYWSENQVAWNHSEGETGQTNHQIILDDLDPATFYYARGYAVRGSDTAFSNVRYFSTASLSTGELDVYFTQNVDDFYSNGSLAEGTSGEEIILRLIDQIDSAEFTVDFCAYNINQDELVNALERAHDRGVVVRYVHNIGTSNTSLDPLPAFPIYGVNPGALMHNKFVIIDAEDTMEAWLIMGSMNFTQSNIYNDYNNVLFIQDEALAKAYSLEFEELWGSAGAFPDPTKSKSGSFKADNTPHKFVVGGIRIESYFSPSDRVTSAIRNVIDQSAEEELAFALLSFTRDDLRESIIDADQHGVQVRGIIENINDQGGEFSTLQSAGIDVGSHPQNYLVHHKYLLIDYESPNADPAVITGSHNWSNSAEQENDENTLIIYNPDIANIFHQEFEARWAQALTGLINVGSLRGIEWTAGPNPSSGSFELNIKSDRNKDLRLRIWNTNGIGVYEASLSIHSGVQALPVRLKGSGMHLISLDDGKSSTVQKILLQQN